MGNDDVRDPADLVGFLEIIVLPVLRGMIRSDEALDGVTLSWEGDAPSRGHSDLLLTVIVEGETFRWVAITQDAPPESAVAARARLASELQDFVAESTFARADLRRHPF